MKVELTEQQINGLLLLLNRVTIQGNEAESIVLLRQALLNALQKKDE